MIAGYQVVYKDGGQGAELANQAVQAVVGQYIKPGHAVKSNKRKERKREDDNHLAVRGSPHEGNADGNSMELPW
jgi:hypothetical protein